MVSGGSQEMPGNDMQSWPAWKEPMQSLEGLFASDTEEEGCPDLETQPIMETFWDLEPIPF